MLLLFVYNDCSRAYFSSALIAKCCSVGISCREGLAILKGVSTQNIKQFVAASFGGGEGELALNPLCP